jgi:colanic acid biosynthesis glycosyl transferase WcaI
VRVLVVSQYFWPETFRVNDIVADLCRRGHTVTVLTGLPNYPEGRIFQAFRQDRAAYSSYAGAEVLRVPLIPRGTGGLRLAINYASFAVSASLLGRSRLRGRDFDVVFIFQASPVTAALPGLLIAQRRKLPAVMWVLDLWPETLAALGVVKSARALTLVGHLVSYIYRRCDLILSQSLAFESSISQRSCDSSRFRYFPGWAEPIFQGPLSDIAPAPEVAQFTDGAFNVLFAGNIGEAQDFPAILDAADRLRARSDIRWLVVGDGRAADSVRAEIGRRDLGGRVHMLGRYPIDRMPSFFRAASALLVSLRRDPVFAMTIPGKIQAYLATGLPLLGMLDGEGARVIAESRAGLVCAAGDGAGLAAQVDSLTRLLPGERSRMGSNGRSYSAREFNRVELLTRLEAWMQSAIAARNGRFS